MMKLLICAALLIVAEASIVSPYHSYGYGYGGLPAVAAIPTLSTQGKYHAQDELGQYSFGHHEPNQVRSETKDAFGIVRGSYSYANADGSIVTNNYIADENGFRSSLAPSNGPLLPLVGKAPKVQVVAAPAPAPVAYVAPQVAAAPAVTYVAQAAAPSVVKMSGAHIAPVHGGYAYGYPASTYGYGLSPYAHW